MKKRLAVLLAVLMTASTVITGCSGNKLDVNAEAVNVDGVSIPLGEVSFMLRYQQMSMQTMFGAYFGEDFLNQDITGTGEPYGITFRQNVVDQLADYYVLEAHAAELGVELSAEDKALAETAAKSFCESNSSKTLNAMGTDEASVLRVLELTRLQQLVYDNLSGTIDTEVDEAEAAQKRISYVMTSTVGSSDADGNVTELTEDELTEKKVLLGSILEEAKASGDLNAAAEAHEMTATSTTYGADDVSLNDAVKEAADQLKDGEFSEVIEAESGYYIVYMESTFDEEATQTKIDSILASREQEAYDNWLNPLKEASVIATNDACIEQLNFDRKFNMKTENE